MSEINPISSDQLRRLRPWLNKWVERIEQPAFIQNDPVSFMYAFDEREDQLLAGFFAAIMAWGRRDVVLTKVDDLLQRMDYRPASFIRNFTDHASVFEGFKHRTFKPVDMFWLTKCLQRILQEYGSFEAFWVDCYEQSRQQNRELIAVFHLRFLGQFDELPRRTHKHISNPEKGSAAKRLYMYLRWVIRSDSPVDVGLMDFMPASELMVPLDVHSARQARALGLLTRTYNDWKAVQELTEKMCLLDPDDPVKYDYALFGIGVDQEDIPEKFILNPQFLK